MSMVAIKIEQIFVIESFIQEICSKTLIHPVMTQVKYLGVIESFIQTTFS